MLLLHWSSDPNMLSMLSLGWGVACPLNSSVCTSRQLKESQVHFRSSMLAAFFRILTNSYSVIFYVSI